MDSNQTLNLVISQTVPILPYIPAIVTAIATTISAILVWKSTKPFISIWFEPDQYDRLTMVLVVENIGQSPAKDVKFEINPDFEIIKNHKLSEIGLFKKGLPVFSPHRRIMTYLTWMPANYKEKIKNPFTITVSYKWFFGRFTQEYTIDLSFYGIVPTPSHPLNDVAENLTKLEGTIRSMGTQLKKFEVVNFTKEEQKQELKQIFKGLEKDKKEE